MPRPAYIFLKYLLFSAAAAEKVSEETEETWICLNCGSESHDEKCEVCGKQCRKPGEEFDTHKRTLTVAHLNHTPEDVRPENLKAMCAPCHLRYDAQHHAETRRKSKCSIRSIPKNTA